MSSKRRASKRKSSEIDSELDMSNPKNWTKQKLITEINNIGIKVPHNLRVTALLQIFMENKTPQDNIQDIIPETAVSNEVIRTVTNENSTVGVEAAAAQALAAMANSGSVQSAGYVQGLEHTYPANHMYTGLSSSTASASVPDSVFFFFFFFFFFLPWIGI